MSRLHNGDTFPTLNLDTVYGKKLSLPADLSGSFGVVLIYRGSWCPYCNAQLAAFSRSIEKLTALGIKVVALSVDDENASAQLVYKHHIAFPVGYGVNIDNVAKLTGAYTNDDPRYLQSTGFVLDQNGKIITAVYSSGAIGRLVPDDVAGLLGYIKSHG